MSSLENPYGPGASNPFDRSPGEFMITYESVGGDVGGPAGEREEHQQHFGLVLCGHGHRLPSIPTGMQLLYFEDIADIPDPCWRFAAEEAKRQEILTWPGVKYAEYNGIILIDDPVAPSK